MNAHPGAESITVLGVAPAGGLAQLRRILAHTCWLFLESRTLSEALALLGQHPAAVLICEATLPDGTWRDLLAQLSAFGTLPPLIVAATHADDHLWVDVLNLGGYNVLSEPFQKDEVIRLVSLAWRHRKSRSQSSARAAGPGAATPL